MAATACPPTSPTGVSTSPITAGNRVLALASSMLVALFAVASALAGPARAASTVCDLYAATNGSDSAPGTLAQPFATVQRLADTLHPGQTGCLRNGTYTQDVTITHTGSASAPITLTSYPGERATLTGRLWIHQGADYTTVSNMNLDGRNTNNLPSPDINAAHTTFTANEVTDEHTAICFDIGSDTTYGRASDTIIQRNRIHDCGALPAANHDHGIYIESSTGAQILENVIYNNADRGIQLYPDAQQTIIEHNIIDANGEGIIFSGDYGTASNNNTVAHNLITNSTLRADIESWYPPGNPTGQGNTVHDNCIWGGTTGTIQTTPTGFTATNNTTANPQYANPATGDYRINNTSPCANQLTNTTTPTQPLTTTSTITYARSIKQRSRHRAAAARARSRGKLHRRLTRFGRVRRHANRTAHRHAGRHSARRHSAHRHARRHTAHRHARRHPAQRHG
jgi:parallel beta-helix repeat protein